jgi:hypothetical protein
MDYQDSGSVQKALSELVSFENIVDLWRGFPIDDEKETVLDDDTRNDQSIRESTLLPRKNSNSKSTPNIIPLITQ